MFITLSTFLCLLFSSDVSFCHFIVLKSDSRFKDLLERTLMLLSSYSWDLPRSCATAMISVIHVMAWKFTTDPRLMMRAPYCWPVVVEVLIANRAIEP